MQIRFSKKEAQRIITLAKNTSPINKEDKKLDEAIAKRVENRLKEIEKNKLSN